jgi:predicted permease
MLRLLRRAMAGLNALLRRDRIEQELDEELRSYLESATERHRRAGLSDDAAVRTARIELGSLTAVKDHVREIGWESQLESVWQDLRYAVRMLRRSAGFTSVAVGSLAIGVGATTAIFTLLNALLLRPLPVDHPEQLVEVQGMRALVSFAMYRDLRAHQRVFTDMAVTAPDTAKRLTVISGTRRVHVDNVNVSLATGSYFSLLGLRPAVGRFFTPDDDRGTNSSQSTGSVTVLSYAFWQRQFGGNPLVIGQTVLLDRSPCLVIGVAPRGFTGERAGSVPDAWVPLVPFTPANELEGREGTFGSRIARLKPGVTREQAQGSMTALFQRLLADEGIVKDGIDRRGIRLTSAEAGVDTFVGVTYRRPLGIVMAVALLVLLIACANVANLLIARGARRQSELGIRLAIGCARTRLIRQLLTESLVLSALGAAAGVAVAYWGSRVLVRMVSLGESQVFLDLAPDIRVVLFIMGLVIATGIGFGIAPALMGSRLGPGASLTTRSHGIVSRRRVSRALVAIQVAVSILLLVGTGLFVRSLRNLYAIDRGFTPDHVILVDLLNNPARTDAESLTRVAEEMQARVAGLPGVESASVSWIQLFSGRDQRMRLEIPDFTPRAAALGSGFISQEGIVRARFNPVSAEYFDTVGMTVVAGRGLERGDEASAAPLVAVVNESMARAYFNGRALGRTFSTSEPSLQGRAIEIVGVVGDAKYNNIREPMRPMFYMSLAHMPRPVRSIEVRTRQPIAPLIASIRRVLSEGVPDVMIRRVVTLSDQVDQSLSAEHLIMRLLGFFGTAALLLACIGLYGVLAYSVTQRTAEIGVRLALGASRRAIMRLVLGDTAAMVISGVVIGLGLALATTRVLASFLYGITPTDAGAFTAAVTLLLATASVAAWLPSWRATQLDSTVTLRDSA